MRLILRSYEGFFERISRSIIEKKGRALYFFAFLIFLFLFEGAYFIEKGSEVKKKKTKQK